MDCSNRNLLHIPSPVSVPLADDAQMVSRQVKEVEAEVFTSAERVMTVRGKETDNIIFNT